MYRLHKMISDKLVLLETTSSNFLIRKASETFSAHLIVNIVALTIFKEESRSVLRDSIGKFMS